MDFTEVCLLLLQLGHTEAQAAESDRVIARQHGHAPGSGLAVLKGTVKFPAGSLRPGAVMVISEESLAHNQCTLVRFLSSQLVSCSAFVNLGHFCFSSN